MSSEPTRPDVDAMRLLCAQFEEAQSNAGEDLSPWKPEGFALIAASALVPLFAERDALVVERDKADVVIRAAKVGLIASLHHDFETCSGGIAPFCFVCEALRAVEEWRGELPARVLGDIP